MSECTSCGKKTSRVEHRPHPNDYFYRECVCWECKRDESASVAVSILAVCTAIILLGVWLA